MATLQVLSGDAVYLTLYPVLTPTNAMHCTEPGLKYAPCGKCHWPTVQRVQLGIWSLRFPTASADVSWNSAYFGMILLKINWKALLHESDLTAYMREFDFTT